MTRLLAAALAAVLALPLAVHAQTEAKIKRALEDRLKAKIDHVEKTPYMGMYEVKVQGRLIYTNEDASYIFVGDVIDAKTRENLTDARLAELSVINWKELPLADAVKTVRGNGTRLVAVFADPNCGYCKRFEQQLVNMDDVTIYTFLYPILAADSASKSRAIWCSKDRSKAYYDMMLKDVPAPKGECDTPIQRNLALGKQLGIDGTPTIFVPSGQRIVGARFDQVQRALEKGDAK